MDWAVYFFVLSFQYPPQRATACLHGLPVLKQRGEMSLLLPPFVLSKIWARKELLHCSEAVQRKVHLCSLAEVKAIFSVNTAVLVPNQTIIRCQ